MMSTPVRAIAPVNMSRRPHRKVRTGCLICKKRRIKCDEGKPECRNCFEFGVDCSYSQIPPGVAGERWPFLVNGGPGPHRGRGRPRSSNWSERTMTIFKPPPIPSSLHTSPPHSTENARAYYLLFSGLAWNGDTTVVSSREDITAKFSGPALSILQPFVLDFFRSSVASHLARIQPQHRDHFREIAGRLSSSGIRGLIAMLPSVDVRNGQTAFAAAVLVSITTLAYGPQPGEYLLFSDEGSPLWIGLFRGIKSILVTVGAQEVFSGPLRGFLCKPEQVDRPSVSTQCPQRVDWVFQFQKLQNYIATSNDPNREEDLEALGSLQLCYEAIWGRADGTYRGHAKNKLVFMWIYYLQDSFVRRLQEKRPIPLVIFAHFAVLMKTLETLWFVSGWPEHIISGVRVAIDEVHAPWMQWPMRVLSGIR